MLVNFFFPSLLYWLIGFALVDMPGLLLNALREASSRNSSVPSHKKLDNSGFSFYGRSYGVASGVGLIESPGLTATKDAGSTLIVANYSYSERGYFSKVQCMYNQTSNVSFASLGGFEGMYPNNPWKAPVMVLQAVGSLPTGEWTGFTTMGIVDNSTAFALAAQANDTHYMYGLFGGKFYNYFELHPMRSHVQSTVIQRHGRRDSSEHYSNANFEYQ
jgi:hypothetical protein